VTVFEGFFDFLSALTYYGKKIATEVIVLNSVALGQKAIARIGDASFRKVHLYLDRDLSGRKLTQDFHQQLPSVTVVDNSVLYADSKDFNEFLVNSALKS
jgi:5S rRNA maturation endonuclease (ribonuclease M5)